MQKLSHFLDSAYFWLAPEKMGHFNGQGGHGTKRKVAYPTFGDPGVAALNPKHILPYLYKHGSIIPMEGDSLPFSLKEQLETLAPLNSEVFPLR